MVPCDRKLSLIQGLSVAASRHADLTAVLGAHAGNIDHWDFGIAKADCEQARSDYDTARAALDDHCKQHGC